MGYLILALIALVPLTIFLGVTAIAYSLGSTIFGWLFRNSASQNRVKKLSGRVSAVAVALFMGFAIYEAFYPPKEFYLGEFQRVTMMPPPESAVVLSSSASYPDLHGDYCSFSRIKLTPQEFESLLQRVEADSRFKVGSMVRSSEERDVLEVLPSIMPLKEFTRPAKEHLDHHFGIRFLNSREHIEVSVCIT